MMMDEDDDLRPSKSQRKREMQAIREMAERLVQLSGEQLATLPYPDVIDAAGQARRITRGNARKRQIQYLAKLLSRQDPAPVQELLDTLDASSAVHVQKFHQLEDWRERLIDDDPDVMAEILELHPDLDRQQLRQLARAASRECAAGDQRTEFRKLFQFLRKLSE